MKLTMKKPITKLRLVDRLTLAKARASAAANTIKRWTLKKIETRPLGSFFSLLLVLFIFILLGNFLRVPKKDTTQASTKPTPVDVFSIGENPYIEVSAKVDKSGVIKIVAQSPGVVQQIYTSEGNEIWRGNTIVALSTNYQGGTIPSVSREIAQRNLDFVEATYGTQRDLISKRRELASDGDAQADQMRDITNQSISDTSSLVSLNEEILSSINVQIQNLEASNVNGSNDALILQSKQAKSGVLTALTSLRSSVRSAQFQVSAEEEPAKISDLSRELTLKQLDIEQQSLDLNREMSKLNLKIAQIAESLMYPASPVSGTVERIHVHIGDTVNPGTVIATITATSQVTNVIALVSGETARSISLLDKSKLTAFNVTLELTPRYVSTEPTDGALHSVLYTLPDTTQLALTNSSYVNLRIPIHKQGSTSSIPFIPIDAVYQTQSDAYIFVASESGKKTSTAISKKVELGPVTGSYVQIHKGVASGDQIILNRNIVAGDLVTIE
jgi:biotin carboxyl carrier protein